MTTEKKLQLYKVSVETKMVVLAEDESEAQERAADAVRIEHGGAAIVTDAEPLRRLPYEWCVGSLPYVQSGLDVPERDIGAWIADGCAPEFQR